MEQCSDFEILLHVVGVAATYLLHLLGCAPVYSGDFLPSRSWCRKSTLHDSAALDDFGHSHFIGLDCALGRIRSQAKYAQMQSAVSRLVDLGQFYTTW